MDRNVRVVNVSLNKLNRLRTFLAVLEERELRRPSTEVNPPNDLKNGL